MTSGDQGGDDGGKKLGDGTSWARKLRALDRHPMHRLDAIGFQLYEGPSVLVLVRATRDLQVVWATINKDRLDERRPLASAASTLRGFLLENLTTV